jgi:hypothetical protein
LNTLEYIFDPLIEYFSAEGKGASKKVLDDNRGFLMEIIQLNNLKTEELIKQYSSVKFKHSKIKVICEILILEISHFESFRQKKRLRSSSFLQSKFSI